ncbi:hypothetical protein B0I35DRAFT_162191 [Stachybotrys elegans]|uniref:Uncharacterized protein n=1 Tax=Stachybotrys elegans TaxID=80388 RepID=A0A8K0SX84_9HYPO|nr:hypothetical protein B0I35DRAFT_162191 [Stachybotrys elegans]
MNTDWWYNDCGWYDDCDSALRKLHAASDENRPVVAHAKHVIREFSQLQDENDELDFENPIFFTLLSPDYTERSIAQGLDGLNPADRRFAQLLRDISIDLSFEAFLCTADMTADDPDDAIEQLYSFGGHLMWQRNHLPHHASRKTGHAAIIMLPTNFLSQIPCKDAEDQLRFLVMAYHDTANEDIYDQFAQCARQFWGLEEEDRRENPAECNATGLTKPPLSRETGGCVITATTAQRDWRLLREAISRVPGIVDPCCFDSFRSVVVEHPDPAALGALDSMLAGAVSSFPKASPMIASFKIKFAGLAMGSDAHLDPATYTSAHPPLVDWATTTIRSVLANGEVPDPKQEIPCSIVQLALGFKDPRAIIDKILLPGHDYAPDVGFLIKVLGALRGIGLENQVTPAAWTDMYHHIADVFLSVLTLELGQRSPLNYKRMLNGTAARVMAKNLVEYLQPAGLVEILMTLLHMGGAADYQVAFLLDSINMVAHTFSGDELGTFWIPFVAQLAPRLEFLGTLVRTSRY